jgi:hypothetical protein
MQDALIEKLRPNSVSAMSGRMAAIVAYILDAPFTEPAISELVLSTDGYVSRTT